MGLKTEIESEFESEIESEIGPKLKVSRLIKPVSRTGFGFESGIVYENVKVNLEVRLIFEALL